MAASVRAMLDGLFGKDRNMTDAERKKEGKVRHKGPRWADPEICKFYLVNYCPNDLFTNTKSDLGRCDKTHDDHLKTDFLKAPADQQFAYKEQFYNYIEDLVGECDRVLARRKRELELRDAELKSPTGLFTTNGIPIDEELKTALDTNEEKIAQLLKEVEQLGHEGKVVQSYNVEKDVEAHVKAKSNLISGHEQKFRQQRGQQHVEVCAVCGLLLSQAEADAADQKGSMADRKVGEDVMFRKVFDHLEGKQHKGYALLRETLAEMKDLIEGSRALKRESHRQGVGSRVTDEAAAPKRPIPRGARFDSPGRSAPPPGRPTPSPRGPPPPRGRDDRFDDRRRSPPRRPSDRGGERDSYRGSDRGRDRGSDRGADRSTSGRGDYDRRRGRSRSRSPRRSRY